MYFIKMVLLIDLNLNVPLYSNYKLISNLLNTMIKKKEEKFLCQRVYTYIDVYYKKVD